ncbi:hypothetical protein [Pseudomonas sp. BW7P1]|uniref:hypothetical protein n=1 Tax=Pseudomonas TaxID=286 RepID=UPI0021AE30EC|nr:hypothetical protein [Pseudomonas sp. BW7P1]UWI60118.1 hypothetical protein NWV16_18645 [Pseudomonas sp. BW7P1]
MPKLSIADSLKKAKGAVTLLKLKEWSIQKTRLVLWRAHWLFPNIIPRFSKTDTDYYQTRDIQTNLDCSLPEGEELRIQVVWGAEVYGPSETGHLCEILSRWGWSAGAGGIKRDNAAEWIHRQRLYGLGGWYNVGIVTNRKDRGKYLLPTNELEIPEDVKYLMVEIFQITPALTCVVIGFALKEKASRAYETELNKKRVGRYERASRWSVMRISPPELKGRAIDRARVEVRNFAQSWFRSQLPGYFCKTDIQRLPTAELITTLTEPLFPNDKTRFSAGESWRETISRASKYDVWDGPDGTSFTSGPDGRQGDKFHLIVSMCKSKITDEAIEHRGARSDSVYISYCGELVTGIISNFASVGFLTEALKDLRLSRASLEIQKVGRGKGLKALENIQAFFDRSLGTPAIAAELKSRSDFLGNFQHDCTKFTAPNWRKGGTDRTIAEELCGHTKTLSNQVISEEHSLREHFEQLSSIISVRESIKAQQRMEILTISALVVAIISLAAAAIQNQDSLKFIKELSNRAFGI